MIAFLLIVMWLCSITLLSLIIILGRDAEPPLYIWTAIAFIFTIQSTVMVTP